MLSRVKDSFLIVARRKQSWLKRKKIKKDWIFRYSKNSRPRQGVAVIMTVGLGQKMSQVERRKWGWRLKNRFLWGETKYDCFSSSENNNLHWLQLDLKPITVSIRSHKSMKTAHCLKNSNAATFNQHAAGHRTACLFCSVSCCHAPNI